MLPPTATATAQALILPDDLSDEERTRFGDMPLTIFESMPDSVFLIDRLGRLLYASAIARVLFEMEGEPEYWSLPLAERIGRIALRDAQGRPLPREDWHITRILAGETITGAAAVNFHATTLRGRELVMSYTGAPIRDTAGRVIGAMVIGRDITEHQRLEDAVRRSESEARARASQLGAILEAMTDGVILLGSAGEVLHTNRAFHRLLALSDEQLRRSFEQRGHAVVPRSSDGLLLPEAEWPSSRILRGEVLGGETSVDVILRAHDGHDVFVSCAGAPVYDDAGQFQGGVLVMRDLTDRRRLERRAHEALAALLAIAEAVVSPGVTLDTPVATEPPHEAQAPAAEPEVTMHPAMRRLAELVRDVFACERVGIVALDPESYLMRPVAATGLPQGGVAPWWEGLGGHALGEFVGAERMARLLDGHDVLLDLREPPLSQVAFGGPISLAAPLRVGSRIVGALAIDYGPAGHHYTEEERELVRGVATIAALVLERERLLREQAASHANELALRASNRHMDAFLSIAAHELRTPLTVIKANVQFTTRRLEKAAAAARQRPTTRRRHAHRAEPPHGGTRLQSEVLRETLPRMERAVSRLERLVSDLLDVSRIHEGKLPFDFSRRDLVVLVRETVAEQAQLAPERTIQVRFPAAPARLDLVVDGDRVAQVLTNYLTNALKYSEEAHPVEVTLTVERELARIEVRDEGPGLPEEECQRIWRRFYRVPDMPTSSGSGVGLGLGLFISRTIIERHGGAVGVRSQVGHGSTFWFTLPLSPRAIEPDLERELTS
jgi:PAS domain S-box-containing protein